MFAQNTQLRDLLAFHTSRTFTLFTHHNTTQQQNRPERKASFLFNILGTIAGNLRAVIELTPI